MVEKKKYPLRQLVNWYFGNYCSRKCFDNPERLKDHYDKLMNVVKNSPTVSMTHRDFLDLFNEHLSICTLSDSFKRKSIGWTLLTILQETPNYESDKIVVENKRIKLVQGELAPPRRCEICKAANIPR